MLPSASALACRREERVQKAFSVDHHEAGDARLSHSASRVYGAKCDYVPVNLVGGVMGQRGERIMHIEKLCGAKVDLSKRFENDMREIRVSSGDAGAVERAVEK